MPMSIILAVTDARSVIKAVKQEDMLEIEEFTLFKI